MAPPAVTVSYPLQRTIRDYEEYTGRTAAVDSLQVRARVSGYLDKIYFKEGDEVKKGDVLYLIDPRPYRAALNQADAQVRLQQAQLRYNEAVYQRDLSLVGPRAVSQEELEKDLAARNTNRAQVSAARANLETANLNLGWTKVTSPLSGRISRTLITRGNLVVADQTVLTTVVSQDPMYVYFDVDEPTVLHIQDLIRQGKFKSAREKGVKVPVYIGLATEKGFPHEGYVDFINNQVDPSTATLQVRGVFANPKPRVGPRLLSPGMFVRVRVAIGTPYKALLVNQGAIGTDQDIKFLFVLNERNEVERRIVKLGTEQGGLQAIAEGLQRGERVIVNGIQKVRPHMVVQPRVVPMPTPPPDRLPRTPPNLINTPPSVRNKR